MKRSLFAYFLFMQHYYGQFEAAQVQHYIDDPSINAPSLFDYSRTPQSNVAKFSV